MDINIYYIVDQLTGYEVAIPVLHETSESFTTTFIHAVIGVFGTPATIL